MKSDLFGNAVVDPMPSRQSLLFHVPVDVAPAPLPGSTPADGRIERQYTAAETPVLPMPAPSAPPLASRRQRRAGLLRDVERELRLSKLPFVVVDDAKRALFTTSKLTAFDFVLYGQGDQPGWLLLCRDASSDNRQMMREWASIFGEGFKAMFAVERRGEVVYFDENGTRAKLTDLL